MKLGRIGSMAALSLLVSACVVRVNSDAGNGTGSSSRPRTASAPPKRTAPPPAAPPAAKPAAAVRPVTPAATPTTPAATPTAAANTSPFPSGYVPPPRMTPAVNVARLQSLRARSPKPCGPIEAAPGVWVRTECHVYEPVAKARLHSSPAKLKVLTSKLKPKVLRRPLRAAAPGDKAGAAGTFGAAGGDKLDGLPAQSDHRADGTEGPIKNQGYVGSCTAYSLSSTIDNAIRRAGKQDSISPVHVWSGYGVPQMGKAGDTTIGRPLATLADWPNSPLEACRLSSSDPMWEEDCGNEYKVKLGDGFNDPELKAKLKTAEGSSFKVSAIEKLASPVNVDELVTTLASGSSVWAAFYIDGTNWSGITPQQPVIRDWSQQAGGHAIEIAGYRTTANGTKQFLIHNSWGESWGDKGYGWINEPMLNKHLKYAYKLKIDGAIPLDLTDDDCDFDELVDMVTLKCGKICSNGDRPNSGCK